MVDGLKILDEKIAVLRGLSSFGEKATRDVAQIVWDDIKENVEAGRDPDGKPWDRRQDGERALRTAMDGLRMDVHGQTIVVRITKRHLVLHHHGYARGNVQRRIIPTTLTKRMAAKIRAYYQREMEKALGGES